MAASSKRAIYDPEMETGDITRVGTFAEELYIYVG